MYLDELRPGQQALVVYVDLPDAAQQEAQTRLPLWLPQRLETLGFIPGQQVQVIQRGWGRSGLLAVLLEGHTLWALRPAEAHCIQVTQVTTVTQAMKASG
jgi:Fe2+ transport system protein FeoA